MMHRSFRASDVVEKENCAHRQNMPTGYLPRGDETCGSLRNDFPEKPELTGIHSQTLASIMTHISTTIKRERRPAADYMTTQPDIDAKMRAILVDWLIDVSCKFKMLPQTIFMTVELIDRYLALAPISHRRLQLVGVTALMIIGKFEEIHPPTLSDYIAVCCNIYTVTDVLEMEGAILVAVGFSLVTPNPFFCLELYNVDGGLSAKALAFSQYFLEVALLDVSHLLHDPMELAAGAIYLARKLLKQPLWGAQMHPRSNITESRARCCAKSLLSIMERIEHSGLKAAIRKYQSSKFFSIARYKIERIAPETAQRSSYA